MMRECGMATTGSYLSCQLRESKLHNGWKNNFFEKSPVIKMGLGRLKNTDKLTNASLEWHYWDVEERQGCGDAVAATAGATTAATMAATMVATVLAFYWRYGGRDVNLIK